MSPKPLSEFPLEVLWYLGMISAALLRPRPGLSFAIKFAALFLAATYIPGLTHAETAEPPKPPAQWKRALAKARFENGKSTRSQAEQVLAGLPVIWEFDRSHGFARLRNVYYQVNSDRFVYTAYRSPGIAITPSDTARKRMIVDIVPQLVPNTPGLQGRIEFFKSRYPDVRFN